MTQRKDQGHDNGTTEERDDWKRNRRNSEQPGWEQLGKRLRKKEYGQRKGQRYGTNNDFLKKKLFWVTMKRDKNTTENSRNLKEDERNRI